MKIIQGPKKLIAKGLLAGLLGGVAGSAAKLIGEAIFPPRTQGQEPPPALLAEKVAGHPLSSGEKTAATQGFHWLLGSGIGAVYGAAAEELPAVTGGYGSLFGLAVLLGTHESVLPLLGLVEPPLKQPLNEQGSEIFTHILYGVTTEAVRRWLMRRWRAKADAGAEPSMNRAEAV